MPHHLLPNGQPSGKPLGANQINPGQGGVGSQQKPIALPAVNVVAKRPTWMDKAQLAFKQGGTMLKNAWVNRKKSFTPEEYKEHMIDAQKLAITQKKAPIHQAGNFNLTTEKLNQRNNLGYADGTNSNSLLGDAFKGNLKHKGGYRA